MIALVDYGLGNIQAFANIYRRLEFDAQFVRQPEDLLTADKIILPGVGSFDWAMERLNSSGMTSALNQAVLEHKVPVLGVCVGMQMMAQRSDEGVLPGLGWIEGEVVRFDTSGFNQRTHLPHMGWNDVAPVSPDGLFRGLDSPRFYFLHSYYIVPADARCTLSTTVYGRPFASAVRNANIYGTQFHPEKSHSWGVQLLRNFAEL